MKRTTKRYVITTSALNCYSYRVLSDGVDFSQYNNNPILLWMHQRANGIDKSQILPLGRVVEIRREGDAWTGQPEFDETDAFAISVYNKYEAGVLNMLSLGATPLEMSSDPRYMLPGQQNPTVLSCKVTDISCVDIGGNDQALPVRLNNLAGSVFGLKNEYQNTDAFRPQKNGIHPVLSDNSGHKPSTVALIENAVHAGKITRTMALALLNHKAEPEGEAIIYDHIKKAKINPDALAGKVHPAVLPMAQKSWDDLKNSYGDETKTLKEHAPEVYKAKFFEKHGRLPAEKNGKPL